MAERIEDSVFQLPDGRRFVPSGLGGDTRAYCEALPLDRLARYPEELLLDTFLTTADDSTMRVQPEHLEHRRFGSFNATHGAVRLHPLPEGNWWLYPELAAGTWRTVVLPQMWKAADRLTQAGPNGELEHLKVAEEIVDGLEFAQPPPGGAVENTYCARHGEPHSRRVVGLQENCPLCDEPVERDDVIRWLVPPRRDTPGRKDLRMQWSRFTLPDWLT